MHTIGEKKLLMLRPDQIKSSKTRPRKKIDEYELGLLRDSIAASGIIEPLAVRKNFDGRYILIAGERRLRAAVMAGLRRVPCILHKIDENTAVIYSVIENMQRSSLSVFEEPEAIHRLITKCGMTDAEISAKLGITLSALSSRLCILQLDKAIRARMASAGLTACHASLLLQLPEKMRNEALDRIIAEGLSEKQTDSLVFNMLNPVSQPQIIEEKRSASQEKLPINQEKPLRKTAIGDVRLFSNSLTKLVDTLQSSGIKASFRKIENDKYIEFKVRIKKESEKTYKYKQLSVDT